MPRRPSLLVAPLLAAVGACSDPPQDPRLAAARTLDELCGARAQAACDRLARCHPASMDVSAAQCVANAAAECRAGQAAARAAVASGRAVLDAAAAARCREALSQTRCGADERAWSDPCGPPVRGAIADGGPCWSDFDCTAGVCELSACPGVCRAAGEGQACGGSDPPRCEVSSYCDRATRRCVARRASGACSGSGECAAGFVCLGTAGAACTGTGCTCAGCGAEGQPCCDPPRCGAGLECDGQRCRAPGGIGDACDLRHRRSCAADFSCRVDEVAGLAGTCDVPSTDGAACWFGWECAPGLACLDADPDAGRRGACGTPRGPGEPCRPPVHDATGDCATSLYCDGTCHARGGSGDACGAGLDLCSTGLWCVPLPDRSGSRCGGLPGAGEACLSPYFCADGTYCDASRACVSHRRAGEACAAATECASTVCESGTCTPLRADGEACVGALQCASRDCRDGRCRAACMPP